MSDSPCKASLLVGEMQGRWRSRVFGGLAEGFLLASLHATSFVTFDCSHFMTAHHFNYVYI